MRCWSYSHTEAAGRLTPRFSELGRLCAGHVRVEEPGKFRCVSCSKLFKAPNFVDKHILNKHPELVNMDALNKVRSVYIS